MIERKDGHTTVGMTGSVMDIAEDMIFSIGAAHNSIRQQSPERAKIFRDIITLFCFGDDDLSDAIFNHYGEEGKLKAAMEKANEKMMEMIMKEVLADFFGDEMCDGDG